MKQRLVTLGFALVALALFYALLFPKPFSSLGPASAPLSTDAGDDGELALWRWLKADNIPVLSLRDRYDHLISPAFGLAKSGNLLLTLMPHRLSMRAPEREALKQWIESGNTLLVMAALEDTPRWTLTTGADFLDELRRMTRLSFLVLPAKRPAAGQDPDLRSQFDELLGGTDIHAIPLGAHPLMDGVQQLRALSDLPASHWRASSPPEVLPLAIAQRDGGDFEPLLWLLRQGQGQVIVCALATPSSNREIALSQNARLLSNIIAFARSAHGSVVFDDAHQGLVDYYDPNAFYGDPRLHHTLWWIVLLWLAFVLGPLRPVTTYSPWQPVDETALISASGRFFSGVVTRPEAARRLLANFFDGLRRRLHMSENGEPLWDWLEAQAAVSLPERRRLQDLYARSRADERVDLTQLHNLLSELQGKLA
ncbi:MAG TPA: DUF4350 domain-containing protein [Steroidobacteraceae bacterium]